MCPSSGEISISMRHSWAGQLSRYSDWLRAGRSGVRILVRARFSAHVQTGPRFHPAPCTMGTGSFAGVKSGRGVTPTPHPLLVPWSRKSRAIPLLPLQAVRPVQSLSACTRVHFLFFYLMRRLVFVTLCTMLNHLQLKFPKWLLPSIFTTKFCLHFLYLSLYLRVSFFLSLL